MEEKKQSKFGVVLLVIIFLIAGVAGGYYISDSGIVGKKVDKETKKTENKDSSEKEKNVEINAMIENLYKRVNLGASLSTWADATRYQSSGMKVNDMDQKYKDSLAYTYFGNFSVNLYNDAINPESYIPEEDVRYAYDSIFGPGTYKAGQTISITCSTEQKYDEKNHRYTYKTGGCGGTTAASAWEKVVSASKQGSTLNIVTASIFSNENNMYRTYDDNLNKKNTLGTFKEVIGVDNTTDISDTVYKYIDDNKDKLLQYTFTFEQDDDGFYYYKGFERTKE